MKLPQTKPTLHPMMFKIDLAQEDQEHQDTSELTPQSLPRMEISLLTRPTLHLMMSNIDLAQEDQEHQEDHQDMSELTLQLLPKKESIPQTTLRPPVSMMLRTGTGIGTLRTLTGIGIPRTLRTGTGNGIPRRLNTARRLLRSTITEFPIPLNLFEDQ